jgi:XTP/dITP diphosphohydrolase
MPNPNPFMTLCFATNNDHKLEEIRALLGDGFTLRTLADIGCVDELPETTGTIPGNSRQKADYVFKNFGVSCFADDSGLEIDALNGAPGVDSAHYSGSRDANQNMARVLTELAGHANRQARFRSVITLILDDGKVEPLAMQFEGIVEGQILDAPRGTGGFGYDPIFQPDGYEQSFGELPPSVKNQFSHRARAFAGLVAYLKVGVVK